MKKILLPLLLLTFLLPVQATHDCQYDDSSDSATRKPKRSCHNNTIKGKGCKECINGEWVYACLSTGQPTKSYVDTQSFSYIHDAVDFEIEKTNPACSSCGGGSAAASVPSVKLERFHKFREMSQSGSFGPGIFSNFDKTFKIYEVNGKTQIDYFDAEDVIMRRYYQQNGVFVETFTRSTKKLELYDANGNTVTDKDLAVSAKLFGFSGSYKTFELFEEDAFVKNARLTGEYDKRDYGITITYQIAANSTVTDYLEKFKINTVSDANGRVLQYQYLSETRGGGWVVSSVTIPNGGSISYNYGTGTDGALESVTYPDETQSTFTFTAATNSTIGIFFEAGDEGSHRRKKIHLDSNFVAGTGGTEGFDYFNAASLLINAIEIGDANAEELAFEVLQTGSANGRRIYEGGGRLRESNIISNRYYNNWTFDGTKGDETRYTGSKEESWEKGDWKFYSGNAQDRMPLKHENTGLLHR